MIKCKNCGTHNQAGETTCISCGLSLSTASLKGDTSLLGDESTGPVAPKRRWGTARFDTQTVLILHLRDFDGQSITVELSRDKTIGRRHGDYVPDVDLSSYEAYDRGVSRQHAVVRRQNDTVVIIDLNSANSTFLNGQRLVADQPRILRDGDEVRLGQLVLRVSFEDQLVNSPL